MWYSSSKRTRAHNRMLKFDSRHDPSSADLLTYPAVLPAAIYLIRGVRDLGVASELRQRTPVRTEVRIGIFSPPDHEDEAASRSPTR